LNDIAAVDPKMPAANAIGAALVNCDCGHLRKHRLQALFMRDILRGRSGGKPPSRP
jgi:hypothetical protein